MPAPERPYQPYADVHKDLKGAGDARPTALQVVEDCGLLGKLTNKTIAITGCNAGIGIETARALYEAGAKLLLTARDLTKMEKVIDDIVSHAKHNKSGERPKAIELHLTSLAAARKGAEAVKAAADGKLNMLIENAGIMAVPHSKSEDGIEMHMAVNHFAHFVVFQELKPLLLKTAKESGTASRVITVSSFGHSMHGIRFDDMNWDKEPDKYTKFEGYGQSKTANVYLANSINRHYSPNIIGLSLHPGAIMTTELGRHMSEDDWAALGDLKTYDQIFKSVEQGAATTVWAAVSPHFEGQNGGRYLADVGESGPLSDPPVMAEGGYAKHAYDEEAEEKLWTLSYQVTGYEQD